MMAAGNPNWWSMNIPPPPQPQPSSSPNSPFLSQSPLVSAFFQYPQHQSSVVFGSSPSSSLPLVDYGNLELPQSWSQLLLSGFSGEEDKFKFSSSFPTRNLVGNWEEETILNDKNNNRSHLKQEVVSHNNNLYCQYGSEAEELFRNQAAYNNYNKKPHNTSAWLSTGHNMMPVSSTTTTTTSCVTSTLSSNTNNNNILDFSNSIDKKADPVGSRKNHQNPDHSSNECNSKGTGGACKKARFQPSSTQSPLKVRKEKLGDRITALHQMVSPFGKTDTASVLLEAIGYIRFLQGQIEALSSPYIINNASGDLNNPQSETSGDDDMPPKDLRSRGLCLVPVSCTLQIGNDNGADYWAPSPFSGGF